jgi:phage-related protein
VFELYYFIDHKGSVPVQEYLHRLSEDERAKAYAYLDYLSHVGYQMRRPHADSLGGRTELYELRPKDTRILYYFRSRNRIILLHAFRKKTVQIPKREIGIALERKENCDTILKLRLLDFDE